MVIIAALAAAALVWACVGVWSVGGGVRGWRCEFLCVCGVWADVCVCGGVCVCVCGWVCV